MRALLLEEIAGLPEGRRRAGEQRPSLEQLEEDLRNALRRSRWVVVLDCLALLALFLLRQQELPFLELGPGEETIFTVGVLAVAVHAGFRLGDLLKLRAVERVCAELAGRQG